MDTITVKDGTQIYYKDWGTGQPLFFHHGWPLSADDWDAQMMFFLGHGYRVIAHDRRGHGRSTQTANGHDMDTYAADVAELVEALDLKNADSHRPLDRRRRGDALCRTARQGRVAKAVLISAIPPTVHEVGEETRWCPQGSGRRPARRHRAIIVRNSTKTSPCRSTDSTARARVVSEGIRENWWRQGMMGGIKAQYDCIKVLSETEFFDDLKMIDVPVLVMHGEDDQICPFLHHRSKVRQAC